MRSAIPQRSMRLTSRTSSHSAPLTPASNWSCRSSRRSAVSRQVTSPVQRHAWCTPPVSVAAVTSISRGPVDETQGRLAADRADTRRVLTAVADQPARILVRAEPVLVIDLNTHTGDPVNVRPRRERDVTDRTFATGGMSSLSATVDNKVPMTAVSAPTAGVGPKPLAGQRRTPPLE